MTLKRPVTLAQARRWPAAAARRESFCARMGGMRDKLTSERTARDPRSAINRALAAWDCDKPEGLQRKHVTKGIRPMKITSKMVGAEAKGARARKNPAQKVEILERVTLPNGRSLRLQKRAGKFDATMNTTGINWHYIAKGVSEAEARRVYDYWRTMDNPARKAAKPTVSRKISQLVREGYPQRQAVAIALEEARQGKLTVDRGRPHKPRAKLRSSKVPTNPRLSKDQVDRKVAQLAKTRNYTVHGKGGKPVATFYARADAIEYGKAYANLHNVPIHISWEKKK